MDPNKLLLAGQATAHTSRRGSHAAISLATFNFHFNPVGLAEQTLVNELARRAVEMNLFDTALAALRQQGEAALLGILDSPPSDATGAQQIATAGVLGSARHEALLRQCLASARGFGRALRELEDCRSRAPVLGWGNALAVDPRFGSEPACLSHLVRRFVYGACPCGACGAVAEGGFIPAGLCWQCGRCRAQTGLRVGTCMERSAIPVMKWFAAIRALLLTPSVAVADLATFLQINRRQTVRRMVERIRTARDSDDATIRLANLDELYLAS
jgi:hypothetical protein